MQKNMRSAEDEPHKLFFAPHLSVSAGFGTLQCRLPWFHRAGPSATLDKGFNFEFILPSFPQIVNIQIHVDV